MEEKQLKINKASAYGFWGHIDKYNKYEIAEDKNRLFLVPAPGAKIKESDYTAFDFYPGILNDFIEMAQNVKSIKDTSNNEWEMAEHILRYCNQYGLFNLSAVAFQECNTDNIDVFVQELDNIMDSYFPSFWHKNKDIKKERSPISGKIYPEHMEYNIYFESISHAIENILNIYRKFDLWFSYKAGEYKPEDLYYDDYLSTQEMHDVFAGEGIRLDWKGEISRILAVEDVNISVSFNGKWKFQYHYLSLLKALQIMMLINITESRGAIRLCDHCNKPFSQTKKNQKYCNKYCADAARSRRYYNKHKKKNQEK